MLVEVLFIPCDLSMGMEVRMIEHKRLEDMQRLVGGYIQLLSLLEPAAQMYINEDGKVYRLPVNDRATTILWGHNPVYAGRDFVVGDAFIIGPFDSSDNYTNVPWYYKHIDLEAY
jgi:hypothetical protein